MLYLDRFVIGALVSATAVAYYATPYEVVTKLFVISGAIATVMFPAFSLAGAKDPRQSSKLYRRGMKYVFIILVPIGVMLMLGRRRGFRCG